MSWKKGESGNPKGRLIEKALTDQIRLALNEVVEVDDKEGKKKKVKRLRLLATSLVDSAINGSHQHAALVLDRVEGKVRQDHDVTTAGQPLTFQSEALSDFASFLAGSVAGEADRAPEDMGTERSVLPDPLRSGETRH